MDSVLCPVLVGRDQELRGLDDRLIALGSGNGSALFLTGPAGIGKSRLAAASVERARARGVRVVSGRAVPTAGSVPYRPLTEALLQATRTSKGELDQALRPWLPALAAVLPGLDLPGGNRMAPVLEPSAAVVGEAIVRLLRGLAADAGLMIVLEDLHWTDLDTLAVVEYLAGNVPDLPLLLLVTCRSEPTTAAYELARRAGSFPSATRMELSPLGPDAVRQMVRACAGDTDPDVVARVLQVAEGVPLLVEEVLASPGVPARVADTVRERLGSMTESQQLVLRIAAVFGREFDWQLVAEATGLPHDVTAAALASGIDRMLLRVDGGTFRFRHALTREAVLDVLLPPEHRSLAARALAALIDARPRLDASDRDLAADLATRSGDRQRASRWLLESGRSSMTQGALATACQTLRRAADLAETADDRLAAELSLVESLALAGRVDEAAAVGARALTGADGTSGSEKLRLHIHLRLAAAAVAATRWPMARYHLNEARNLLGPEVAIESAAEMHVLDAEMALVADDPDRALEHGEAALALPDVPTEIRCHAWELIGRCRRLTDLPSARAAFEQALLLAQSADRPLWRLRAMHELGTIDLFDHIGVDRLLEARRIAEEFGAISTAAVLGLQLAAGYTGRWELAAVGECARFALEISERLRADLVRSKAYVLLAGAASMRGDMPEMERLFAAAAVSTPDDPNLEAFRWLSRGLALILNDELSAAIDSCRRGMAAYQNLPHAEPAAVRALMPLILAVTGAPEAAEAARQARRLGVGSFRLNTSMIEYAEAVLAGRAGSVARADEIAGAADAGFQSGEAWRDLVRFLAAPAARADGWGDPRGWLSEAARGFEQRGNVVLAQRCRAMLAADQPNPWQASGITRREADVLRLILEGCSNRTIGEGLCLSPRTVEKHVESLMRKTGTHSRTELALAATRTPATAATTTRPTTQPTTQPTTRPTT